MGDMQDIQWEKPRVTIETVADSTVRTVVSEREKKDVSHRRAMSLAELTLGLLIGEIGKE